jgi:hypothetical protein
MRQHLGGGRRFGARTVSLIALFAVFLWGGRSNAQALTFHGGPIMQRVKVNVIFWLPPGTHYDLPPLNTLAQDQLYENTIKSFFSDLSGTSYLNILRQYIGQCGPNSCVAPENPGGVSLGSSFVDLTPYPESPLSDGDVQNEVQNIINQKGLAFDLSTEFFVFTAASIQECHSIFGVNKCTGTDFCAYHWEFDFNGSKIVYAYMANLNSIGGCVLGLPSAPNQSAADQEVVAASHELFESITDPEPPFTAINILNPLGNTGWWASNLFDGGNFGDEIGDDCNRQAVSVTPGTAPFVVQNQFSNDSLSCVTSFGPSVRFDVTTGDDDLRGDSSATAQLITAGGGTSQVVTLKAQGAPGWNPSTTNAVLTALRPPTLGTNTTPLGSFGITLTSHDGFLETPDNWNIENVAVNLNDPFGNTICSTSRGGDPLVRLTASLPSANFALPCPPPPIVTGPTLFDTITFVIGTGGDDLRGDSSATATLFSPGSTTVFGITIPFGPSFQTVTLKAQNAAGFPNNSSRTLSFPLNNPMPLSAIAALSITLTSHDGFGETDDNWNIQSASISLSNSTTGQSACFANALGNPFVRLTNSAPTTVITAGSGC